MLAQAVATDQVSEEWEDYLKLCLEKVGQYVLVATVQLVRLDHPASLWLLLLLLLLLLLPWLLVPQQASTASVTPPVAAVTITMPTEGEPLH